MDPVELIERSNGQIITVEFVKRTTGEVRIMNCRLGVKSYLKGGVPAYDPKEKGLIVVFDMQSKGYRSIPVESILRITCGGKTYRFDTVSV